MCAGTTIAAISSTNALVINMHCDSFSSRQKGRNHLVHSDQTKNQKKDTANSQYDLHAPALFALTEDGDQRKNTDRTCEQNLTKWTQKCPR